MNFSNIIESYTSDIGHHSPGRKMEAGGDIPQSLAGYRLKVS